MTRSRSLTLPTTRTSRRPTRAAILGRLTPVALAPIAVLLAAPLPASAGTSAAKVAATASAREFLAGETKGTTVSADGRVRLGLDLAPLAWPEDAADAVVFAAAAGRDGRIWIATGGGQGRLFVAERGKAPVLAFTAKEPHLTAVAVSADGTVACAGSPNGVVYRVDPSEKEPAKAGAPWGDPKEAAIWSLAFGPDGTLYAGTGNKGRLYRRGKNGEMSLVHETEDTMVRSLAVGPDGTVYAGTAERGLVLAIPPTGPVRTLHDFARPEVSSLAVSPDGRLFAVGTSASATLPAPSGEARPHPAAGAAPSAASSAAQREEVPKGSVSVSSTISTSRPSAAPSTPTGAGSEIVFVRPDGVVEPAWTFPEDAVYSMRWDAGRGALLVATGPRGRLYALKERRLELLAQADEKQVVATVEAGGVPVLVTSGAPGILRAGEKAARSGRYVSGVKDALRTSFAGRLRWEGDSPAGSSVVLSIRAGNSSKPDATWSAWTASKADAKPALPAARYFQWKAELAASRSGDSPVLERVELWYSEANLRPVLESVAVLEPGAVFPRAASSSGPAVLSVTNPDEHGIFAGLESPRDGGPDTGGKKLFRKGFRTVSWKATDPNGDALRFDVEIRKEGSGPWIPLRRELEETWVAFDTTSLPDGRYRFRVTASDRAAHAEGEALSASEESDLVVVDNTPPSIRVESKRQDGGELVVSFSVEDALSPIARAEGAVNADRWRLLAPDDGLLDSQRERFTLRVPKPSGPAVLSLRAADASGNVAAATLSWPGDFP